MIPLTGAARCPGRVSSLHAPLSRATRTAPVAIGERAPTGLVAAVPEVRAGLAAGALAVATAGAVALGAPLGVTLGVLAAVVAAGALTLTPALAALVGLTAWALATGFAEHDGGRLTGTPHDLLRLAGLTALAVAAAAAGRHASRM